MLGRDPLGASAIASASPRIGAGLAIGPLPQLVRPQHRRDALRPSHRIVPRRP